MVLDRKVKPSIQDASDFNFKLERINTEILSNNIPLYWLNIGIQDVIEIHWVFEAGIWFSKRDSIAQATAKLLKQGTKNKSAYKIHNIIEYYGAQLTAMAGNDYLNVRLSCITKYLPQILPIIFEILTEANFPEEEFQIFKQNTIQKLLINSENSEFVANQKIDIALFGSHHPYGWCSQINNIEALTTDELNSFFQTYIKANRLKIFVGGKFKESDINLIKQYFSQLSSSDNITPYPQYEPNLSSNKKQRYSVSKNEVQAAIRIGSKCINRTHPDFSALVVLNSLFGGYFGSRLMNNLREDKGYTYGIYSNISTMKNDAILTIQTEAGYDVLEKTLAEIYIEMDKLTQDKIKPRELRLVKNYLLGSILADLESPFNVLQRWKGLILNNFNETKFQESINTYKTISAKDLQDLAQQHFSKNNFIEVVVS